MEGVASPYAGEIWNRGRALRADDRANGSSNTDQQGDATNGGKFRKRSRHMGAPLSHDNIVIARSPTRSKTEVSGKTSNVVFGSESATQSDGGERPISPKPVIHFAVSERAAAENSHLSICMIAQFVVSLARPTTTQNVTVDECLLMPVSLVAVKRTGTNAR